MQSSLRQSVSWYGEVSVFSHHASVFSRIGKNPIPPVLFTQSVRLSELSVLIGRSMLHFLETGDIGTSWSAHRALTRLCQQQSVCSHTVSPPSWDGPVYSAATFPATIWSQFKLDWKERDNKQNKMWAGAKTGRGGGSRVVSQRVSCYS